jgi:hypothetical protein
VFESWTAIAQQQGFHPKYGFPDDGEVAISSGSGPTDWRNLAGAVSIADNRYGENTTPGQSPTAGTQKCNAIYARYGRPPVYQQADGIGGVVCADMWMFEAAVDHASVLQRNALAAGLEASKSVDFPFPEAPNDFTGYHSNGGGEFWRRSWLLAAARAGGSRTRPSGPASPEPQRSGRDAWRQHVQRLVHRAACLLCEIEVKDAPKP